MAAYQSDSFDYDPQTRVFSQDASMLEHTFKPMFHQVYQDAIDDGLAIVSSRTGRKVSYVVTNIKRNADQDILFWELSPIQSDVRIAQGTTVIIFNT